MWSIQAKLENWFVSKGIFLLFNVLGKNKVEIELEITGFLSLAGDLDTTNDLISYLNYSELNSTMAHPSLPPSLFMNPLSFGVNGKNLEHESLR